jgi:hypothetical protein
VGSARPATARGQNLDVTACGPAPSIAISFHEGVRFDVEYWTAVQLGELIDRLGESAARESLSHGDMDALWRLHTGQILLGDRSWFEQCRALVRRDDLGRELARRAVYSAEVRLDDAAGLLAAGEPVMAALATREAFARVIDAVLSQAGSVAPPSKWRMRRLRDTHGLAALYEEYLSVETMADFRLESPASWVRSVVLRSRELLRAVDV